MNGMKHSKTMSQKKVDPAQQPAPYSRNGGPRPGMDKSSTNYTAAKREGGPFGK